MKNNKPLTIYIVSLSLLFHGCSYNGTIDDSIPMKSTMIGNSSNQGVTLIDNRDEIQNPKFKHGVATLNYDVKDSLLNVAKTALKSSFSRVDVSKTPLPSNKVYAIPSFDLEAGSGNDITTGLVSHAKIDLYDTTSRQLINRIVASKSSSYDRPGSLNGLGFLTGFTLFLATPFTLPAATNIAGNSVAELIKENEKGLAASLGSELASKQHIESTKEASENCYIAIERDPSLRILSGKVSLFGVKEQSFDMLANTKKPTAEEKEALRTWGAMLDRCVDEDEQVFRSMNTPREIRALFESLKTNKTNLIIALYNGEITYGEFARKRREKSAEFDAAMASTIATLDQQARESEDRQRQMAIERERTSIARAQANAAESMAFNSMISNIQQANSNMIQQQTLNRLNTQPIYRPPVHTTCTPGYGSVNCTTY